MKEDRPLASAAQSDNFVTIKSVSPITQAINFYLHLDFVIFPKSEKLKYFWG